MSGLGFQKKNGSQTTAFKQLEELQKLNRSDLRKEANEFYGFLKPFSKGFNFTDFGTFYFPPAYGRYNVTINAFNGGGVDGVITWFFYLGNDVVQRLQSQMVAGARDTKQYTFIGRVDKVEVLQSLGNTIDTDISFDFNGFVVSNDGGFAPPSVDTDISPNADGNVHLTTEDLTSLGYTYQWIEATGQGSFINPNNPSTVFVPDGNGDYILQLVVTDGDVSSSPLEIPVTIDYANTIIINNLGGQRNSNINLLDTYSENNVILTPASSRKLWQPYKANPAHRQFYLELDDVNWNFFNKVRVLKGGIELPEYNLDSYNHIPQIGISLANDDYVVEIDSYTREIDDGCFITFDGVHADNAVILNMSFDGQSKHYAEGNWLIPYGYLNGAQSCYIGHQYNEFDVYDSDNVLIGSSAWVAENNRNEYTLLNLVSSSYKVTLR